MIQADHPWNQRFARFSLLEAQHGLLDDSGDIMSAQQWHAKLQEAGLMIKGNRLRYQEGVKRKRLPPKRMFLETSSLEPIESLHEDEETLVSDFHETQAVSSIDSDLEDEASLSENQTAELPTRCRKYGVGKEIGYAVYVHREYEELLGPTVEWAKRHLPEHYEYTVVKLNQRNDSVSFIQCPGFDSEHEPAIAAIVVVSADGNVQRRTVPTDPYIYHHKWLFVSDEYRGFDVAESKARSLQWISLRNVDRSRIGRKSYWEQMVVPRLNTENLNDERWVRNEEARRVLKLSTCELAHAREAGEVRFKKVGNAFLYLVRDED